MTATRRDFLKLSSGLAMQLAGGASLFSLGCVIGRYGPLLPPDDNGMQLPEGFRSRILANTNQVVPGTDYTWHTWPDGGATFRTHDGWIYVSNSEDFVAGGVGALRFDPFGEVIDAYSICGGTLRNCAGGATPWGTWLTCEEFGGGLVHECDPYGIEPAVVRPALGTFAHEAVAVDPVGRHLYLTEDVFSSGLYRFTPHAWTKLDAGVLEIAEVDEENRVHWHVVPNPNPTAGETPTRDQVPERTAFRGGEGIVYDDGHIYFTTKLDNRVWDLDLETDTIRVLYAANDHEEPVLRGVDNITVSRQGDLLVAEDGGNMEIVLLDKTGAASPFLRILGQETSEICGPAFDPWHHHLYFSSQRGTSGPGITYAVTGPFLLR